MGDDLTPRKKAFLEHVLERARAAGGVESASPMDGVFGLEVRLAGESEARMLFLDNLFGDTLDVSPDERDRRVGIFVQAMCARAEEDVDWEEAKDRLLPVIRSVSYLSLARVPMDRDKPVGLVSRGLAPFVRVGVALDSELTMRMVKDDDLGTWSKTAGQVIDQAIDNLGEAETAVKRLELPDGSAVFQVVSDDSYESSRLAVPGWLASFADKVNGRPIAVIPERAQCIVTGDGSPAAVRYLLEVGEREWSSSARAISPAPYTSTDDGAVVPYRTDGELGHEIARAHVLLLLREYQEQGEILEERFEEDDVDLWVAKPFAVSGKDGPVTMSVWPEGVEGLLPVVDRLVVQKEEGDKIRFVTVAWKDAVRLGAAHLKQEEGLEPPRWRLSGFPSASELAAMEAVAIEVDLRDQAELEDEEEDEDDEDDDESGED